MRILIFGCGYLGRRVADAWIGVGNDVFAVTRSQQNAESFRLAGIQPVIADVCDLSTLQQLPEAEVVLHAVGFDRNSGQSQTDVMCGGMRNVLSVIGDRCDRFIQISSSSVYGQSAGEWVDELSECRPTQPGGRLCVEAERMVRERFSDVDAGTANILRLAGIYGPGRLLSRVETLKVGGPLVGRGDSWLNLIHVDDAVSAVIACERHAKPGETYLVVDDRPIERAEYFGLLARLVGAPVPTFDSSQPSTRGSGGLNKRCSNRKLCNDLNWSPAYPSIATGLRASMDNPAM